MTREEPLTAAEPPPRPAVRADLATEEPQPSLADPAPWRRRSWAASCSSTGAALARANEDTPTVYATNRARLVDGLAARFGADFPVTWDTPAGGFLVVVTVPFPADDALLTRSARDHGVLLTPMHHFYDTGLDRLSRLVTDELANFRRGAEHSSSGR